MRMVALTEIAEERQPEHVFFCHPFFCDADTSRMSSLHVHNSLQPRRLDRCALKLLLRSVRASKTFVA